MNWWLKGQLITKIEALKLSHYPANFNGYRWSSSRDIMVLISHIIKQDQDSKELINFMDRSRLA